MTNVISFNQALGDINDKLPHVLFPKLENDLAIALTTTGSSSIRRIAVLGNNTDVDSLTLPEDIWSGGGAYPFLAAATSLEIVSTSVNDISAGTGARTIQINGLDANYNEVSQIATLNGTTPVALTGSILRINSALIMSAGSTETNQGTITIRDVSGGTVRAHMPVGAGITRHAIYTVPNGYTLIIKSNFFSFNRTISTKESAEFTIHIRSSNGFYREPLLIGLDSRNSPYRHDGEPGITIPQKTDVTLRCTYVENDNMNLSAAFLGILVSNTQAANLTY